MEGKVTYNHKSLLSGSLQVEAGGAVVEEKTITENGTYNPPTGVDGFAPVIVNVPERVPILQPKNINTNGQYLPEEGYDGFSEVNVNVPVYEPTLTNLYADSNGTYTPGQGIDGYNLVEVDVPEPILISKSITENGTYTPGVGVDGYDEVIVNVQPSGAFYHFESAFNGQIVVRIKYSLINGKLETTETLWFFNGYEKPSTDVIIPDNLLSYVPIVNSDVFMTSAYSSNTSETQLGWLGFLYPSNPTSRKLRSWTINTASLLAGTFWAVLDPSGTTPQTNEWFDPFDI